MTKASPSFHKIIQRHRSNTQVVDWVRIRMFVLKGRNLQSTKAHKSINNGSDKIIGVCE